MSPTPRPKLRWKRWLLGSVAIVVALVVGVPFAYIHFIEGSAPAALALSSGTSGTTATTSSGNTTGGSASAATSSATSVDGTWTVATGSIAGYRVGETLFGQSATAVGRTTAITGSITLSGTSVTAGSFTADLTKVSSDKSQRDSQFQGRIMDTAKYPTATFTLTGPIQLGTIPADGTTITKQATGNLTLHGTTKAVTVTITAKRSGTTIQVAGSIPITFADYNIPNPTFAGVVSTQDHGTLEFLLDFTQA